MLFSEISIITVETPSFGQNAYIAHRVDQTTCFLVDTGFDPDMVIAEVERRQLEPAAILITHGHIDHIAGISEILRKWSNCDIWIGDKEKDKLSDPMKNLSGAFGMPVSIDGPIRSLADGEEIEPAEIPIRVLHIPGHSRGHVAFQVLCSDRQAVFVGDIIFSGSIGRTDFPDGNMQQLLTGIREKILSLPEDTLLFPGHGPSTTVGEERQDNPFLNDPSFLR